MADDDRPAHPVRSWPLEPGNPQPATPASPLPAKAITLGSIVAAGMALIGRHANLALFPLLGALGVFGVGAVEHRLAGPDRVEPVTSTVVLDSTPEEVWSALIATTEVSAVRPFLLRIGLPVPVRCTLEG